MNITKISTGFSENFLDNFLFKEHLHIYVTFFR